MPRLPTRPARVTFHTEWAFSDSEPEMPLMIHATYFPEEGDGWNEPRISAWFEMDEVYNVRTRELLDPTDDQWAELQDWINNNWTDLIS